ncbi:MAG: universal stress protein [Candidatus Tectimicrobiota bacterium]
MFNHILTPLDGSPLASCIFPHVVAFARATGARITLLRVLERRSNSLAGRVNPCDWQIEKREGQAYLDEMMAQLLQVIDVPVHTALLEGPAAEQIIDYAHRTEADLLILSSHGEGGLSDWHVSSVAHKVIQRAGTSVLLVRAWRPEASCEPANWGKPCYHRILVPLDGSQRAECVLPLASVLAEQAEAFSLVHVVTQPELFQRVTLTSEDQNVLEQIISRNQQQAEHYFSQLQGRLMPTPQTHIFTTPNATATLHRFVAEEQIDLVVLSAHGLSGQAQWPFGRLTQSFIDYGETPLLIVQDMPLGTSSTMQTAIQSTVYTVRTASVTGPDERLPGHAYYSPDGDSEAAYLPRAERNYAYAF